MATAHSVIHIFVKNGVFPQFYSKNGQKKGGVNSLPLFQFRPKKTPKHGGEKGIPQKSPSKQGTKKPNVSVCLH